MAVTIPASVLQELIRAKSNLRTSAYTCAAGMMIMLYDWILTFPDEVRYIWSGKQKMSKAKAMFFWNRYFVVPWIVISNYHIAGLRGPLSNNIVIPTVAIIQGISIIIGIQLLALRVLALYKNNRLIRIGLFCYLAICHTILLIMTGITMARFVPSLIYIPVTGTCYSVPDPLIRSIYLPPLLAEGGIVLLQIVNHVHRRRQRSLLKSPLVSTLFRDGYLYFALVLTIRLFCLFIYEFADPSLWFIANQMDFPISTALITRFFLQLRGAIDTEDETVILRTSAASHSRRPIELSKATGTGSVIRPTPIPISIPTSTPGLGPAPLSQQQQSFHDPEFHIQWQSNTQTTVIDPQDEEEPVPLKELRRLKSGRITPSYSYGR
ncbi:hypothetical protein FRC14_007276 [Serendipita sp. 396]|nr:hypothetical protein FRC14_007276 [Serendipita sp. 396]